VIVAVDGSPAQRLQITGALVDALLASPRSPTEVADVLDHLEDLVAVFPSVTPWPTNAAWRARFATHQLPAATIVRIADVAQTGIAKDDAELCLAGAGAPVYVALALRRSHDASSVIAVCADVTDEVMARRSAAPAGALLWGGPRDEAADYASASWLAYGGDLDWKRAVHAADLPRCVRALAELGLASGSFECDARLRRADGEYRWHHVRFAMIEPGRWCTSAYELEAVRRSEHEREAALAAARAAQADAEYTSTMKDRFLAAVSHELRAPVTTIVLWEQILRASAADGTLHLQAIDAIHQSALAQGRLVDDLLDVSRAISGKLHVDLHPVDVEGVLAGAIASIAPIALAKQITLERHSGPVTDLVLGDGDRLRQILGNLLGNAVKFTDARGHVSIAAERIGDRIAIAITDSGRGITPELRSRLFEPFSQSEDALTSEGGLGLGLAIAKQLAELHHGTLEAASAGPGQGATFTLTLPCADRQRLVQDRRTGRATLPHVRVLVVDDDWRVREALALLLDRAGAIVDTAESAAAAREKMKVQMPAIVVSDIAMPGENGYHFMRQLRATGCAIPAIALTAHATRADIDRAHEAGYEIHLAKPVDFEKLVERIDELVVDQIT